MPYIVYFLCFIACIGLYFYKSEASRRFWAQRGSAVALMMVLDASFILSGFAPSSLLVFIVASAFVLLVLLGIHARELPEDWSFFQKDGDRSLTARQR